jgi:hypothetical protein
MKTLLTAAKIKTIIGLVYLSGLAILFTPAHLMGQFYAYNDCVFDPCLVGYATDPCGNSVHYGNLNYITNFGAGIASTDHQSAYVFPTTGELKNYATGAGTGVTATLTANGSPIWQAMAGCVSSCWSGGYDTAPGTDAYNTFHGIVDMTGTIYYGTAGWWVDVNFTGLDPSKSYTFATSASRAKDRTDGEPNAYPTRWSI